MKINLAVFIETRVCRPQVYRFYFTGLSLNYHLNHSLN